MDNKEQEVSFNHAPTKEELCEIYRQSKKADPASVHYKRILVRPSLHIKRVCLFVFLCLLVSTGLGLSSFFIFSSVLVSVLTGLGVIFLSLIIFSKPIAIWLIKVYQRFASEETRNRCRYEPSCSQYMIGAITKYGLLRGVVKGFGRLRRCRPPNGGYDEP